MRGTRGRTIPVSMRTAPSVRLSVPEEGAACSGSGAECVRVGTDPDSGCWGHGAAGAEPFSSPADPVLGLWLAQNMHKASSEEG